MPKPTIKKGTRVGAIQRIETDTIYFFGYGKYCCEEVPTVPCFPQFSGLDLPNDLNPKIELDSGDVVYGCECMYWGPEDAVADIVKQFRTVSMVDITEARAAVQPDKTCPLCNLPILTGEAEALLLPGKALQDYYAWAHKKCVKQKFKRWKDG